MSRAAVGTVGDLFNHVPEQVIATGEDRFQQFRCRLIWGKSPNELFVGKPQFRGQAGWC